MAQLGLSGGSSAVRRVTANAAMPLASERTGGTAHDPDLECYNPAMRSIFMNGMEEGYWERVKEGTAGNHLQDRTALAEATIVALGGYCCDQAGARGAARKALEVHQQCPEAYALLGLSSDTLEEALEHYRQGEDVGGRNWKSSSDFTACLRSGKCWKDVSMRAYMRCVHGVANCLRKLHARSGDTAVAEEALAAYQRLQRMQADRIGDADYVNFMYHLPEAYLRCGDLIGFDKMWADRKVGIDACLYTSSMLGWIFGRMLRDYRSDPKQPRWQWLDPTFREVFGMGQRAASQEDFAYRISSHGGAIFYAISNFRAVVELLTGKRPLPDSSLPVTYGSAETLEQAVAYVASAGDLWDEGARTWLRQHYNMVQLLDLELPRSKPGNAATKAALRLIKEGIVTADIGPVAHRVAGPLHKAAYYDAPSEIISALLEAGLNPTATGGPSTGPREGTNPVEMAANQGNFRPLRLLMEWCQKRMPAERYRKLQRGALDSMLTSSVYYCVSGRGPKCMRCLSHAPPHGAGVNFNQCAKALLDTGMRAEDLPPCGKRDHPILLRMHEAPKANAPELPSPQGGAPKAASKTCAMCHKTGHKKCAACLAVSYCSQKCQRQHWKKHRGQCAGRAEPATSAAGGEAMD